MLYDPAFNPDADAVASVANVVGIAVDRERLAEEVTASRRALAEASSGVLLAGDHERRRIARDLHDGLQVSLVRLSMQAHELAAGRLGDEVRPGLERLAADVDTTAGDLRSFVHGVMPALLVERGLEDAVRELALTLPLRIEVRATGLDDRLRPEVESTAYFVVAEALTNVVKHASARRVELSLGCHDGVLRVAVADDGTGLATGTEDGTSSSGSGLDGLRDRLEVLGGSLRVAGGTGGTRLEAVLPCA